MDLISVRLPESEGIIIILGTFTIKINFGGTLGGAPYHTHYLHNLRLRFLGSVRIPTQLKPFGTLATIKTHLAPRPFLKVFQNCQESSFIKH